MVHAWPSYDEAPIGLCYIDTDFRYVRINEWLARINGLPMEEHIGRTVRQLMPDLADGIEGQLRQVIETAEPLEGGGGQKCSVSGTEKGHATFLKK